MPTLHISNLHISGHRNLDSGGHTGFAKEEQFQGPGWQEFVEIKAAHWLHFYKDWLENNPLDNLLVLHYENIQQNPEYGPAKNTNIFKLL